MITLDDRGTGVLYRYGRGANQRANYLVQTHLITELLSAHTDEHSRAIALRVPLIKPRMRFPGISFT